MKTLLATLILVFGILIGNKIGFESAKAKYHGAQQEADWKYGCTIKQQMPNGDCP